MVVMAPLNPAIPPAAVKVFEEKKNAIIAGTLNPFLGPVKDNSGAEKIAPGKTLSDIDFNSINWYVAGVEGSVPK
jgi:simple sugar transport system substrate-binding protein